MDKTRVETNFELEGKSLTKYFLENTNEKMLQRYFQNNNFN